MQTMSQAEFARAHGVSRAAVSQWKKRGYLVLIGNLVDVDATNRRLRTARQIGFDATKATAAKLTPERDQVDELTPDGSEVDDDETLTADEEAHRTGFHTGIRSVVADLVPGLPAIAAEAALQAGVPEDSAQAFRAVFHDRLLGHLAQILAEWELPSAGALVERVRNEAR